MKTVYLVALLSLAVGCAPGAEEERQHNGAGHTGEQGGRLLEQADLSLELLIDGATGTPEFRAWVRRDGELLAPDSVDLSVTLSRLGGEQDVLEFKPVGNALIGDAAVRYPHSFEVDVALAHGGETFRWSYESLEGRTRILPEMAEKFGLTVASAGPALIAETIEVFGTVTADPARTWLVEARFPGIIRSVSVRAGDSVVAGAELARVESDESLKPYTVTAPASGVVVERLANVGEQTAARRLFRIVDPTSVWAQFKIFPGDRASIRIGQEVLVHSAGGTWLGQGVVDWLALEADEDQSVLARVELENPDGLLLSGTHLQGQVTVARHEVGLAVQRSALQSFKDFSVVYRQVGEVYEVRMLTLGRQDDEWVEVLDGLNVGDVYVTSNSYLVKADIDKDSASHDH